MVKSRLTQFFDGVDAIAGALEGADRKLGALVGDDDDESAAESDARQDRESQNEYQEFFEDDDDDETNID